MVEEVKVSVYKVATCGYYPRGGDAPRFGRINEILQELRLWGSNKRLAHTKTFDPRAGSDMFPVYLVDVTPINGSWLLTLWNEAHNTEGTIASINGQASVGSAEVAETAIEDGHIPGHASYFWFLPEHNVMVSIRFQHATTGVMPMNKYLRGFVRHFTSNVVLGDPDEQGQCSVIGYRADENSELEHLWPRFSTKVHVKQGPIDYIVSHAQSIRKLKRKAKLQLAIRPERRMFQRLLAGLKLAQHQTLQKEAHVQYEVEIDGLADTEVNEIINQWYGDDDDDSDYGFMIRGDAKEYWLGKAYARDTLALEVTRNNLELVEPHSLLRELDRHKNHILNLMN